MNDKYVVWTNIKGKKYPLCLTIGAADVLEKAFGNVNAVVESVTASPSSRRAWIEISRKVILALGDAGRPPRGGRG